MIRCSFVSFPESFVHCSPTERETQPHKVKWINGIRECLCSLAKVTRRVKCCRLWPVRHWVLWLLQSCVCNALKDPLLLEDMVRSLLDLGGCWARNFSNSLLLIISVADGLSVGSNETSQSTNLYWKKNSSILLKFFINLNSLILNFKKCFYLFILNSKCWIVIKIF